MTRFLQQQIDTAGWLKFFAAFGALLGYSYWAFALPGAWARASAATALPETLQGFPAGQPAAAFAALGDARGDYLLFQLIDIPFACLNAFALSAGIALALRRLSLGPAPLRFLLLLPLMLLAAEIVEDALLAMMASEILPVTPLTAGLQQAATNLKFASMMLAAPVMLIGVALAGGTQLASSFRRTRK